MMIFSDEVYLSKVSTRGLYFDKKSKEEYTGKVKKKYKLAGIQDDILSELQIFRFFVGTSKESSCQKALTLKVEPEDWEDVHDSHSSTVGSKCGYFDVRKVDILNREELLTKIKDPSNGFGYVAKLKYECFGDLQSLALSLNRSHKPIPPAKVPHILNALIKKSDAVDEIMLQLGLGNKEED